MLTVMTDGALKMPNTPPLSRQFLVFLGPLIVTNVLQAMSGTVNSIYIGRMLGVGALAAVSGFIPVLLLLISFVIGLGSGASILVAQAWGARESDCLRAVAGTSLCAGVILGLAIALCGSFLADRLMRLLGTPPDVLAQAVLYAEAMLIALPALFLSILVSGLLRGTGDTVTPLRALLVSTAITLVGTPALIRGWAGLPQLGVRSGAVALLAANVVSLTWTAWYLRRRQHVLAPTHALRIHMHIEPAMLRRVVKLGIPTGLFFITGSLADLGVVTLVNAHGSPAIAAWGAVNQVMAFVQFPAMSIAIASAVFAGQAIGGGRLQQLDDVTRIGLSMNLALTGGLAVVVFACAPYVVSLFVRDSGIVDLAAGLLHITVWGSIFFGCASVFTGVMRASGTVLVPTAMSLGCLAFLLFPLSWAFERTFGLRGIWMAYPVTYLCALILQAIYFHSIWKSQPIRKMV